MCAESTLNSWNRHANAPYWKSLADCLQLNLSNVQDRDRVREIHDDTKGCAWGHSLSLSLFLPLSLPLLSSSPIPLIASLRNGDSVTANPKCCGFSSRRPCPLPPTRRSRVTTCPSWASPTPVNGKWHWTLTLYVLHFISSFTEDREHSFEHQQVWWPHK